MPEWPKGCDWKSHARDKTRAAGSNPAPSVSFLISHGSKMTFLSQALALQIKNLHKSYRSIHALRGINLEIKRGELLALLGPNGAGKTTTIRIISGLTDPDAGEIFFFGHNFKEKKGKFKRLLGLVPQQINLDLELTVMENLIIHGLLFDMNYQEIKAKAEELLHLAELSDRKKAKVKELSGGMRRRLLIVRALLHSPKLLLLDEPTVGLDPHIRRKMWHFIKQIQEKGTSILLTTHYMEEAEYLANRVAFIFNGKILKVGEPSTLVKQIGEYALDVYQNEKVKSFYFQNRQSMEEKILELTKAGFSLAVRRVTLEDVFLKLLEEN